MGEGMTCFIAKVFISIFLFTLEIYEDEGLAVAIFFALKKLEEK